MADDVIDKYREILLAIICETYKAKVEVHKQIEQTAADGLITDLERRQLHAWVDRNLLHPC